MVSLGMKRAFYLGKSHSCISKRERKVEKHRLPFPCCHFDVRQVSVWPIERASNRRHFPEYQAQRALMLVGEALWCFRSTLMG